MIELLSIPDVLLIRPKRIPDPRGWFSETYNIPRAEALGWPTFIQDNESLSIAKGTLRGLHFQRAPFAQAKLVRCVRGSCFDVAVDIRPNSPTHGQHVSTRLTADGGEQLLIPTGFAHGFCTLEPMTLLQYKVSALYAPAHEGGIAWNDPALGIDWPVSPSEAILSDRDRILPLLSQLTS